MNQFISRILVPVDFSPHSDFTLQYAARLAARLGAELHVIHAVEPIPSAALAGEGFYLPDVSELQAALVAEATRRLDQSRAALSTDVVVTTEALTGHPPQVIAQAAQDRKCDLIAIGTHGRTGIAHLVMGSVAERVTRLAPCPVLIVRETDWNR
jgi:universal stress protein A